MDESPLFRFGNGTHTKTAMEERMTRREEYEQRTEALLQPILDAHHFELVEVEYVKEAGSWYLRAYIDK